MPFFAAQALGKRRAARRRSLIMMLLRRYYFSNAELEALASGGNEPLYG